MSIINLNNICKKFGEKVIFDNFSLNIDKGDFVVITGTSGKGKTTLLNIIGLIEQTDSGDIEICGTKNPKYTDKHGSKLLREQISYLFQNYGLIEEQTVYYNMKIATRFLDYKHNDEKNIISEALKKVGLSNYERKKIYQLSGGEQQRVALARIFVKPSKIILADEPTGSLDKENRDIVMNILKVLNDEGKTIVMVTHDLEIASFGNKVITL